MKKINLIALICIFIFNANGQKADVTSAILSFNKNDIESAKKFIDKAGKTVENKIKEGSSIDEKTHSKFWYYKGEIYFKIALAKDPAIKQLYDISALDVATKSYKSLLLVDIKKRYTKEAKIRLNYCANNYSIKAIESYNIKDYHNALMYFEKTLKILESHAINKIDTITIKNAAMSAQYAKKYDEAIEYTKRLIELNYGGANNYRLIAQLEEEKGDTIAAFESIKQGRLVFPSDKDLIIDEYNYFLKQGKQEDAIKNLELAINSDPNNKFLYGALGSLFLENSDHDSAIKYFQKAIKIDSNYAEVQYQMGVIYVEIANKMIDKLNNAKTNTEYNKLKEEEKNLFRLALPYFEKSYQLNEKDTYTLDALKRVYYKLEMYEKSIMMKNKLEKLK